MAGISATESSRMWLATAQMSLAKGIYNTALYCAEMAVEIALKSVLLALEVDVPKVHEIVYSAKGKLEEHRRQLPKEFLEKEQSVLDTMEALLDLRPAAGYVHEVNIDYNLIESQAKEYVPKAAEAVEMCSKAVEHINKSKHG